MIAFIFGKDRFRVLRRRAEWKKQFLVGHQDGEVLSRDALEDDVPLSKMITEASGADLFGSHRLVVIENACALPDSEKDAVRETLKILAGSPSADFLFVETDQPKSKDPLFAFLKKHAGSVEEFGTLSEVEARKFLECEAKAVSPGVAFSRAAADRIISLFGGDSAWLASIAETLAIYRGSGEISLSDIDQFVSENPKEKVFAALDALVSGNRGRAAAMLLKESRADSGGTPKLFGLLAWQLRELLKVRGEYDRGRRSSSDIARTCGMNPYVAGKLLLKIPSFPLPRLKRNFVFLANLDADMKSGRIDPELALTLFVEKF